MLTTHLTLGLWLPMAISPSRAFLSGFPLWLSSLAFASSFYNTRSHPQLLNQEISLPVSCHWLLNPPTNTQNHETPSCGNHAADPGCSPGPGIPPVGDTDLVAHLRILQGQRDVDRIANPRKGDSTSHMVRCGGRDDGLQNISESGI
jgi:hypothetical protein